MGTASHHTIGKVTISGNLAAMVLSEWCRRRGTARNRRGLPALQKRLRDFDTSSRLPLVVTDHMRVLWSKQRLAAHPTPVLSSARLPLVVTGTLPGARRHSTITNLTCNFRRLTSGCNRFLWFHGQARRSETRHPAVPSGADLFTSPLIPPTLTDRNAKRRHPQRSAFGQRGSRPGRRAR